MLEEVQNQYSYKHDYKGRPLQGFAQRIIQQNHKHKCGVCTRLFAEESEKDQCLHYMHTSVKDMTILG